MLVIEEPDHLSQERSVWIYSHEIGVEVDTAQLAFAVANDLTDAIGGLFRNLLLLQDDVLFFVPLRRGQLIRKVTRIHFQLSCDCLCQSNRVPDMLAIGNRESDREVVSEGLPMTNPDDASERMG